MWPDVGRPSQHDGEKRSNRLQLLPLLMQATLSHLLASAPPLMLIRKSPASLQSSAALLDALFIAERRTKAVCCLSKFTYKWTEDSLLMHTHSLKHTHTPILCCQPCSISNSVGGNSRCAWRGSEPEHIRFLWLIWSCWLANTRPFVWV